MKQRSTRNARADVPNVAEFVRGLSNNHRTKRILHAERCSPLLLLPSLRRRQRPRLRTTSLMLAI